MEHKTVFSGRYYALEVYYSNHQKSIVTFASRNVARHPIEPRTLSGGFAKGVFSQMGFNEFLIGTRVNDWYQNDEIFEVIDIINSYTLGDVFTYGSSMGAFGAVNYAAALNAKQFVALAPQYSIDPSHTSDTRWIFEFHRLNGRFKNNLIEKMNCSESRGFVFFDQSGVDLAHAKLIEKSTRATLVPLELGGHSCGRTINKFYPLKKIIQDVSDDEFSVANFYKQLELKKDNLIEIIIRNVHDKDSFFELWNKIESKETALKMDDVNLVIDKAREVGLDKDDILQKLNFLGTLLTGNAFLLRKARWLKLLNCPNEALKLYKYLLTKQPKNVSLLQNVARIYFEKGDGQAAIQTLREAVAYAPDMPGPALLLSHYYYKLNDIGNAEKCIHDAIDSNGHDPKLYHRLGVVLFAKNEYAGAKEAFQKAIELDPKSSHSYYQIGCICSKQKDICEAIDYFGKAIDSDSNNPAFYHMLGRCLLSNGDLKKAEDAILNALALQSDSLAYKAVLKQIQEAMKKKGLWPFRIFSK